MEGKPFHLLAAHCQHGEQATVVGYIRGHGLSADTPNLTVSSFGGHPGVKGNGYVPYYMVFDHRGDLRYHHMCGNYHGGRRPQDDRMGRAPCGRSAADLPG